MTTIEYVRFCPAITGSGESVLTIDRSAVAITLVVSVAVLLDRFGSGVVLVTVAVLLNTVPCGRFVFTVDTIVIVADAPTPSVPIVQVGADHVPTDGVALIKVKPEGRRSVAETFCAILVPLLVT